MIGLGALHTLSLILTITSQGMYHTYSIKNNNRGSKKQPARAVPQKWQEPGEVDSLGVKI